MVVERLEISQRHSLNKGENWPNTKYSILIDCIFMDQAGSGMNFWNLGINGAWVQILRRVIWIWYPTRLIFSRTAN